MIASYLQLLSRRYKGRLDSDADTFIGYAVEGAERLQSLLRDLLELQQVGKGSKPQIVAPLSEAVERACQNLALLSRKRAPPSGAQNSPRFSTSLKLLPSFSSISLRTPSNTAAKEWLPKSTSRQIGNNVKVYGRSV